VAILNGTDGTAVTMAIEDAAIAGPTTGRVVPNTAERVAKKQRARRRIDM